MLLSFRQSMNSSYINDEMICDQLVYMVLSPRRHKRLSVETDLTLVRAVTIDNQIESC